MFVITKSKSEKDVGTALEKLVAEMNSELRRIDGHITDMECEVSVGPLEASVSASLFIDGDEPREKYLLGVNEKGYSRESSMKKAEKRLNSELMDKQGRIAGSYVKTIVTLPGRVYTTLIVAVNGDEEDGLAPWDAEVRRRRIKRCVELLGGDPNVINVARLAARLGISRTMVYKDLEALGYKRR